MKGMKSIGALAAALCVAATATWGATGGAPSCVTKIAFQGTQAGQSCSCSIGSTTYNAETTGEYEIEVCGGTLPQCGGDPCSVITAGGAYEFMYRNFVCTPAYLDQPGTHNVTITFEVPGCVEINAGCSSNYASVSATVAVTVPALVACGPCKPDDQQIVCKGTACDYSPGFVCDNSGFSYRPSDPPFMQYITRRKFNFTKNAVSQGAGSGSSERIFKDTRVNVYKNGALSDTTGWENPYNGIFTSSANIACHKNCAGDAAGPSDPQLSRLERFDMWAAGRGGHTKAHYEGQGDIFTAGTTVVFKWEFEGKWDNQEILVSGTPVGQAYNGNLKMSHKIDVVFPLYQMPPCCANGVAGNFYDFTCTPSGDF